MADEKPTEEAAPPKSSGSKLVPILLITNTLMVGGGVAAFWMKSGQATPAKASAEAKSEGGEGAKGASGETGPGAGPTVRLSDFVIHLRNPEADRYARVSFDLELVSEEDKTTLTPYLPRIRDAFITYLSDRTAEEMRGSEGLDRIKHDLLKQIDAAVPGRHVRNLYVADFVLQ